MPSPYSNDLRKRIISDILSGMSRRGAAKKYSVSHHYTNSLYKQYLSTGSHKRTIYARHRVSKLSAYHDFLFEYITQHSDVTLSSMQSALQTQGLYVHDTTILYYLKKQGISYKKNSNSKRNR